MRKSRWLMGGLALPIGLGMLLVLAIAPDPAAAAGPAGVQEKATDQNQTKEKKGKKPADEKAKDATEASEEEAVEEEPVPTPTADAVQALAKQYDAEMKAFMAKTREKDFMRKYREAAREGRESAMAFLKEAGQPDREKYAQEFDEIAAQSLAWLAINRRGPNSKKVVDLLFEMYPDSPAMELVVPLVASDRKQAERRLRRLMKSPHEPVQGLATMELADLLARKNPKDTSEVEELYQTVIDKHASLDTSRGPIGDRAKSALFELQHLSVGKVAPEIAAQDLDGTEFKLTDYRGKVVLLDFWGNW